MNSQKNGIFMTKVIGQDGKSRDSNEKLLFMKSEFVLPKILCSHCFLEYNCVVTTLQQHQATYQNILIHKPLIDDCILQYK